MTGWLLTVGRVRADHLHVHIEVTVLGRRRGLVVHRLQLRQGQSGGYYGYQDIFQTLRDISHTHFHTGHAPPVTRGHDNVVVLGHLRRTETFTAQVKNLRLRLRIT